MGSLCRTRQITIGTILIQWDANSGPGILQFYLSSFQNKTQWKVLKCVYHDFVTAPRKPVKMFRVMSKLDVNIVAKRSELNSSLNYKLISEFYAIISGCLFHASNSYVFIAVCWSNTFFSRGNCERVNYRKSVCVRGLHATSHDCIQVSNYSFDIWCKFGALFPDNYNIFKRAKFVFVLHTFPYFL